MKKSFVGVLAGLAVLTADPSALTGQTWRSAETEHAMAGFGGAVAVSQGEILVGEAQTTINSGAVYVFRKDADGAWTEALRVAADDAEPADGFGASIAVDGDRMAVGTTGGAVYVMERERDSWTQVAKLMASDAGDRDAFGSVLTLNGDRLVVGAPGQNNRRGAAYVFERSGTTWTESGKIAAAELRAGAQFGVSMAFSGDRLLVGAPIQEAGTGAVYVFEQQGGSWVETGALVAEGLQRNDRFGSAIAPYSEGRVLVSAPRSNSATGAVWAFIFNEGDGAWQQIGGLAPFDLPRQSAYGSAMAFAGEDIWVSAPFLNNGAGTNYVYVRDEDGILSASMKVGSGEPRSLLGMTLAAEGDLAVAGMVGADGGAGRALVFEKENGHWSQTADLFVEEESLAPVVDGQVDCEDDEAAGFGCSDVDLVSFLPIKAIGGQRGTNLNDIWGWTDPESGKEYALVGRTDGTSFVDISNPGNPIYIGDLPKPEQSPSSSWRDIKVYQDHAFIVADAASDHGMQVFDLARLRDFTGEPQVFDADAHYDRIHSAHNIVINEESGFAYSVGSSSGGETCGGGLHMIDVRDPKNPTFAGCFSDTETGRSGTGYSHDAQCVNYVGPDPDYEGAEICIGSNETALSIADVTDKANPVAVSRAAYPSVAYAHQGWLTEDHTYFYMNDEGDESSGIEKTRTLVWDLTDLDDPQLVLEHMGTEASIDHNLYIVGDLMYQSNYVSGLRILDISDRENPVEVGFFDTHPWGDNGPRFQGSWSNYPFFESGTIAVSSIGEGLFILKKKTRTVF